MLNPIRPVDESGRLAGLKPFGVIDIGSNSVRLVVYEGAIRAPAPLFNEKVLCGLGRKVASTGRLGTEAVERAVSALSRFRAIANQLGVETLKVVATAAVREAQDGPDFIAAGEATCGCRIEVLSGQDEARLAAQGIRMGVENADGFAGDLGGGSLELIDLGESGVEQAVTLPLGGLRLIDVTGGRLDKAQTIIDEHLAALRFAKSCQGRTFYAVGGTWRALARMHMAHVDYPLHVMHGYTMPAGNAVAYAEMVRKAKKLNNLRGITEVAKARREVLPYGALLLERLLLRLQPARVEFSVFGLREGLLYEVMSEAERRKDPLISFCEDYARMRSRSVAHARELCQWTDALFAEGGLDETPAERRLRHGACLLSDIGWRAHPDYRGEQSLNVVAHAALSGIDHEGRIFLALSIYYRHAGQGEGRGEHLSARLKMSVSRRTLRRARIVGCAIRAAHMLSVGMPGVIPDTPLLIDRERLVLKVPRKHIRLDGERLRRRFATLAELVERRPVVEIGT